MYLHVLGYNREFHTFTKAHITDTFNQGNLQLKKNTTEQMKVKGFTWGPNHWC